MKNAFFFQTQQISDHAIILDQFKKQTIFFSYFQVDQKYYLFVYSQKSIEIDFIYQVIDVIQELDSRKRKLRSIRGFLLYALEFMKNGKDSKILSTNLQPFFWKEVKNIIRQNKKGALQEFLFGSQLNNSDSQNVLEEKIQNLQNQLNSLQQKVIDLETKAENQKYVRRKQNKAFEAIKSIQQEDYTSATQIKAQNDLTFITLGKISEQEKVEIIKLGFQLNQEGKISLKKYYQGKGRYTLFEWKGYQIKYDSIRKTKLYQQLSQ
jgi:hypothetical protein